jgi:hypothetical protein
VGTLLLCTAGSIVIGIGVCRINPEAPRRAGWVLMMFFCALGFALLATGAAQAQRWSERIMIIGAYAVSGVVIGEILQRAGARRRAGAILAKLGAAIPMPAAIGSVFSGALGIMALGIAIGFFDQRAFGAATVIAWNSMFASIIARGTRRWLLTQSGFLGLGVFVRWPEIEEYRWTQAGALSVTTSFSHSRPFIISIPQKIRRQVDGILSDKLPEKRREERQAGDR